MKFGFTAGPQQMAAMTRVLDAYCKHAHIEPGTPEEDNIAEKIIALYQIGLKTEHDLANALILPPSRCL